jgi:CheY-like chemotaxis protein
MKTYEIEFTATQVSSMILTVEAKSKKEALDIVNKEQLWELIFTDWHYPSDEKVITDIDVSVCDQDDAVIKMESVKEVKQ